MIKKTDVQHSSAINLWALAVGMPKPLVSLLFLSPSIVWQLLLQSEHHCSVQRLSSAWATEKNPSSVELGFCFSMHSQFSMVEHVPIVILRACNSLPCPIFSVDSFKRQFSAGVCLSVCTVRVLVGGFMDAIKQLPNLNYYFLQGWFCTNISGFRVN